MEMSSLEEVPAPAIESVVVFSGDTVAPAPRGVGEEVEFATVFGGKVYFWGSTTSKVIASTTVPIVVFVESPSDDPFVVDVARIVVAFVLTVTGGEVSVVGSPEV